ncbi:MAG TPA: serine hydrolase, partial [Microvirga sp.]|nr:serine hydrolase [Microvirga sp.]
MSGSIRPIHRTALKALSLSSVLATVLLLGGATVALAQDAYPHANEPIGNVEQIYDGALAPDLAVNTFRNIDRLFPTRTIKAGGEPSALPKSEKELGNVVADIKGEKYDIYDYL